MGLPGMYTSFLHDYWLSRFIWALTGFSGRRGMKGLEFQIEKVPSSDLFWLSVNGGTERFSQVPGDEARTCAASTGAIGIPSFMRCHGLLLLEILIREGGACPTMLSCQLKERSAHRHHPSDMKAPSVFCWGLSVAGRHTQTRVPRVLCSCLKTDEGSAIEG